MVFGAYSIMPYYDIINIVIQENREKILEFPYFSVFKNVIAHRGRIFLDSILIIF